MHYLFIIGTFLFFTASVEEPSHFSEYKNHPFYVSVTELEQNEKDNIMEVSIRIFTDDFENTLKMSHPGKIDLLHPTDKNMTDKLIKDYIVNHLKISFDGKPQILQYVGYEQNEEAVECYFQINQPKIANKVTVSNNALFEYKSEQINIVHVTVKGKRKSSQLVKNNFIRDFTF